MRDLIAEGVKVQTIVTSPPYYGLRNYGVDGQLGLEETPQQYIANMVEVFSVAWDLLADDGTLWLNIGDSYSSHKDCKSVGQTLAKGTSRETAHVMDLGLSRVRDSKMLKANGFKNKELMMIPARLAIALSDAGWYLRQDIIWAKPNVMPESVKDRCTKSHEHIFLLTKSDKYYFDNDAIKEISTSGDGSSHRGSKGVDNKNSGLRHNLDGSRASEGFRAFTEFRNKRDVWFIPSMSNSHESGGHFATFPEEIPETCILAGTKVGDIVFDPFMGSGTVGKVAQNLGRKWLGSELNPDYIKIQNKRTSQQSLELA
jgi:site-specific DNA-methyltransferase (cytosine-N4-specific)